MTELEFGTLGENILKRWLMEERRCKIICTRDIRTPASKAGRKWNRSTAWKRFFPTSCHHVDDYQLLTARRKVA